MPPRFKSVVVFLLLLTIAALVIDPIYDLHPAITQRHLARSIASHFTFSQSVVTRAFLLPFSIDSHYISVNSLRAAHNADDLLETGCVHRC